MDTFCPFCKSDLLAHISMNLPTGEPICYVSCRNCRAIGPSSKSPKKAFDKWVEHKTKVTFKAAGRYVAIRNCVFCGEEEKITVNQSNDKKFYVQCEKCKSTGSLKDDPFDAVNNWNYAY